MKIVIFEVEAHEVQAFEVLKADHEVTLVTERLSRSNAKDFADAEIVSTFVYSEADAAVLQQLPALKMLATRSTGFDHIDTNFCKEHNISVCNVPVYGEHTVAEHVFALLLTISHRMPEAIERARKGPFSPQGLEGFDLNGKVLGVLGTGSIGRATIGIAKGFGMRVIAFDAYPNESAAKTMGFDYMPMDDVLSTADILTLHLPANPETENLLSAREFGLMKDGVIFINTARGSVVQGRALVQALKSGKVAAAGLDVLTEEPMIREEAELVSSDFVSQDAMANLLADHVLLRMPNVVLTPHSGFNTKEAMSRIVETTIENIEAFGRGQPQNTVG